MKIDPADPGLIEISNRFDDACRQQGLEFVQIVAAVSATKTELKHGIALAEIIFHHCELLTDDLVIAQQLIQYYQTNYLAMKPQFHNPSDPEVMTLIFLIQDFIADHSHLVRLR